MWVSVAGEMGVRLRVRASQASEALGAETKRDELEDERGEEGREADSKL